MHTEILLVCALAERQNIAQIQNTNTQHTSRSNTHKNNRIWPV